MSKNESTCNCLNCLNHMPHNFVRQLTIGFTDGDNGDDIYADDNGQRTIHYDLAAKFKSFDEAIDFAKRHNLKNWEV